MRMIHFMRARVMKTVRKIKTASLAPGGPALLGKLRAAVRVAAFVLVSIIPFGVIHRAEAQPQSTPNVLVFLVDDLGWRDTACYGSSLHQTPAIDALAADGMRFTQAYSAHPRCVPSRMALMTGRLPARLHCPGGGKLEHEQTTIAEAFTQAGYATCFMGKWHLGGEGSLPTDHGFEFNVAGGAAGAPPSYFYPYNESKLRGHRTAAPLSGLDEGEVGEYLTDRLTDEAITYLENHQRNDNERPFLMVLAHYAVHTPLEAKPDMVSAYQRLIGDGIETPSVLFPGDGETKQVQDNAIYAAMVQSTDQSLARILESLESLGLAENTIVVFTSDHGGLSNRGEGNRRPLATSNAPLRAGKGHCYEGGIRIPLIVRWPGRIEAEAQSTHLVNNTDLFPTLLQAAGQALLPEQHVDGESFADVLFGEAEAGDDDREIFWHSPRARPQSTGDRDCSVIRRGDWKLMAYYDGGVELYNLAGDPYELNNIADEHPDTAALLMRRLEAWRRELDVVSPRQ